MSACKDHFAEIWKQTYLTLWLPRPCARLALQHGGKCRAVQSRGSTAVSNASLWGEHNLLQSKQYDCPPLSSKEDKKSKKATFRSFWDPRNWAVERNRGEKQSSKVNASELICKLSSWVTGTYSSSAGYWYTVSFWKCPENWRKLYHTGPFSIYCLIIPAQLAQLHKPFSFSTASDSRMRCFKAFVVTVVIKSSTVQP